MVRTRRRAGRRRGEEVEQVGLGVQRRAALEMRRHRGVRGGRRFGEGRRRSGGLPAHQGVEAGERIGLRIAAAGQGDVVAELDEDVVFAEADGLAVLQRLAVAAAQAVPGIDQQHPVGAGVGEVVHPVAVEDGAVAAGDQALRVRQDPVVVRAPTDGQLSLVQYLFRTLTGGQLVVAGDGQSQRHCYSLHCQRPALPGAHPRARGISVRIQAGPTAFRRFVASGRHIGWYRIIKD